MSDGESTPPEIQNSAQSATAVWIPEKSKARYLIVYQQFVEWKASKNITSFSENVLLAYFYELSETLKPSSLWPKYSMLKSIIKLNHNVDIANYGKLITFLKRKSENFVPKKSRVLSNDQVNEFLTKAPDEKYLMTKVALILGICGACRKHELYNLKTEDFNDLNGAVVVTLADTKNKKHRSFSVTGSFYYTYKKYADLRPPNMSRFFLHFNNNKCSKKIVGTNTLGKLPAQVAEYLKLPEYQEYTGHCFRRTSATPLSDTRDQTCLPKKVHTDALSEADSEYFNYDMVLDIKPDPDGEETNVNNKVLYIKPDPDGEETNVNNEVLVDRNELKNVNSVFIDTWNSRSDILCCINGCPNTTQNCQENSVEMYLFPKRRFEPERLEAWISAVRELNCDPTWERSMFSKICSEHFVGGKTSEVKTDASYIPTIRGKLVPDVKIKSEFENNTECSNSFDAATMCDMYSENNVGDIKFNEVEKPQDDSQIFCDFVADQMRNISNPELRQELKAYIQKGVLEFTEKDDESKS